MSTIDNHITNCLSKFQKQNQKLSCFASPGHCRKEGIKSNPDSTILTLKTAVIFISNYMALMLVHMKLA